MPVNINLNKVNWSVQSNHINEIYSPFYGKVCFNDNQICSKQNVCVCEPCHRCGNSLCVCPLINQPYHDICGEQLACWCPNVEELDMTPTILGMEKGEQDGSVTAMGDEQGGSGSSMGLIQGKFPYNPQENSNKGERIYLGPQHEIMDQDGFKEVKGKNSRRGGAGKTSVPNPPPNIPPSKRSRGSDDTGRAFNNIVNHPTDVVSSILNENNTFETEETERGDKVTVRDELGNIKHQYLKDTVFEERVFNGEMWNYYRNLHSKVIRKEVERLSAVVNHELTGYILLPYLQYGTPQERLVNVYQSFSRVTIFDKNLNRDRYINIEGENWDIRVQGTNTESMFALHCKKEEHSSSNK